MRHHQLDQTGFGRPLHVIGSPTDADADQEDGVEVDQIVLSSVTYFDEAHEYVADDSVVVPMTQSALSASQES